jgi:hypothetical protein
MVANAGGAISLSLGNTKMSTGVTRGDQATGISLPAVLRYRTVQYVMRCSLFPSGHPTIPSGLSLGLVV